MKICAISDTHSLHRQLKIPKCDVLIHCGDTTSNGSLSHLVDFNKWLTSLFKREVVKKVLFVAGNHDKILENDVFAKLLFADFISYLQNNTCTLENGMKVYGTPYTPEFNRWYFMHPRKDMYEKVWSKVPEDTDILISHGPPYKCLDELDIRFQKENAPTHVGCKHMKRRIKELPNLKYVFCGHIHSGYGKSNIEDVQVYNCSVCNEDYDVVNKPHLLEI